MRPAPRKLRSPLKWHGGKSYLARRIVELMPEHSTYVEPFAGGLSVLLNKPRVANEYASDAELSLIVFWRAVQDRAHELAQQIRDTPYREETFVDAKDVSPWTAPDGMFARNFLVRNRMSRGGLGKSFAWSDRLRGGRPGDENAWLTMADELGEVADRLRDVDLSCSHYVPQLMDHDGPETLFYFDPPYLPATRSVQKAYTQEMSLPDHLRLPADVATLEGMILLSGYRSPLYDAALEGWSRVEFDMPNHSGQSKTKQRRIECVWLNPAAVERIDDKALQKVIF